MKHILLLITVTLLLTACGPKRPEFKEITKVQLVNANQNQVQLSATLAFSNPNPYGYSIQDLEAEIRINDDHLTTVTHADEVKVGANGDFTIKIEATVSPVELYASVKNNGIGMLLDRSINLKYEGYVRLKAAKVSFKVPFNDTETININDFL